MADEIWIVPFFGQGHMFPSIELCKHLASRNVKTVLVISSKLSSTVPLSLRQYPLVEINEISEAPPLEPSSQPLHRHHEHHSQIALGLEKLLSTRNHDQGSVRPPYAVVDMKMSWTFDIFNRYEVPAVSFFTSGACSAAVEYAMWKAYPLDVKAGETRLLPGLPEEMAITVSDLKRQIRFPTEPPPQTKFGPERHHPTNLGDKPPWVEAIEPCIGVMINTCDELEQPFIEYVSNKLGKPVWGAGPFLPEQYWKSAGSVFYDHKFRTNQKSNVSENEVNDWLDTKPSGSVLYISFGTVVRPFKEEYEMLTEALEALTRPFVWVVQANADLSTSLFKPSQPGSEPEEAYFPHELQTRVGNRGLIIRGWAPQLLILSHPSTGGFLSHCGWNSTVEAIGRGVPFLAWPIRGDQHSNAKLITNYLKVGYMISEDVSQTIKKENITRGIEKLLNDQEMKQRAVKLSAKFEHGFPTSSVAALDAFGDFIRQRPRNLSSPTF